MVFGVVQKIRLERIRFFCTEIRSRFCIMTERQDAAFGERYCRRSRFKNRISEGSAVMADTIMGSPQRA